MTSTQLLRSRVRLTSQARFCRPAEWVTAPLSLTQPRLEFKVVLLLWVDQFASCCGHDLEEAAFARRQLYVAMTRAQDELHLFGHGNVAILDELQQSQSFEVVRARAASLGSEPIHEQKSARGHEQTLQVKFRKRHEPAL